MEGSVELAAWVGAEDDVAVGGAFVFFAEGVGVGGEFVAGDGEGFAQSGEVGEDDGAGVFFGLVRDVKGAAEHGGQSPLKFVGGGLIGGGVAGDYDGAGEGGVAGGVGDGGVAEPGLGAVFCRCGDCG